MYRNIYQTVKYKEKQVKFNRIKNFPYYFLQFYWHDFGKSPSVNYITMHQLSVHYLFVNLLNITILPNLSITVWICEIFLSRRKNPWNIKIYKYKFTEIHGNKKFVYEVLLIRKSTDLLYTIDTIVLWMKLYQYWR